jgi:hypothetical protein
LTPAALLKKRKMRETNMAKEVTTTNANVPAVEDNEFAKYLVENAGAGGEDLTASDFVQPFWKLLQSLSPECDRSAPEYVPGAAAGCWFDVSSREVFDSVLISIARPRTEYIEWKTRAEGGGFIQNHGKNDNAFHAARVDKGTNAHITPDGNEIVQTGTLYAVVVGGKYAGDSQYTTTLCRRGIFTFTKSAFATYKQINASCMSRRVYNPPTRSFVNPDVCGWIYELTSQGRSNEKGRWSVPMWNEFGRLDMRGEDGKELFDWRSVFTEVSQIREDLLKDNGARYEKQQFVAEAQTNAAPLGAKLADELGDNIPF